jgi:hypothetical protein
MDISRPGLFIFPYIAILSDFLDKENLKVLLYKKSRKTRWRCVVRLRSDCYILILFSRDNFLFRIRKPGLFLRRLVVKLQFQLWEFGTFIITKFLPFMLSREETDSNLLKGRFGLKMLSPLTKRYSGEAIVYLLSITTR